MQLGDQSWREYAHILGRVDLFGMKNKQYEDKV